ncbi:TlpA disulfide reductase family protein [Rhodanobacter sp. L36]|uniref:TlpA family protein disulfide reductase n=1 Tax=Rhodanobacter sp. L36 TaxID=1747221 RepID=UPI00131B5692|nr:TlpA disulfide reductase family protein [Rhodanobacter sp. L36]
MRRITIALFATLFCISASAMIKPGDVPPNDLGRTRDNQSITVSSLHGKVVVISFWATWCGYCMKEMPVLANLQELATQKNLALQVVSVDSKEDRKIFANAARVLHPGLPDLLLTWDRYGRIGEPYGASKGIPVMVMLHRDGTVAHVHVGYGEDMLDSLVSEINALLAEPVPATVAIAH